MAITSRLCRRPRESSDDFVVLSRMTSTSFEFAEAFQALAFAKLSNSMTTNRLGAVPSSGVILSVRMMYLPPKGASVSGPDLAGTALKPSGSVTSVMSTTT
jgi:hypothetical protein